MPEQTEHPGEPRKYRSHRSDFRARSHDSAHSDESAAQREPEGDSPDSPADNPLVPRGEATSVYTDEGLAELIDHVRSQGAFAYDSEFIGELTYIPKLCVIQVATSQRIALIDPLTDIDLDPFWELICDPSVEKIVHAGLQDLEPAVRRLQRPPANVFDVQIASGFIGLAYPMSLSKLVKEFTGVFLGKGLTFTHWDQRPLSEMQLRYAADDVRYLPAARAEIGRRLDVLGHTAWAVEESSTLCEADLYRFDADVQLRRVRGSTTLTPPGLAILRELVAWRDKAARAHDVPARSFLRDEILVDLSRNPIRSLDKLARIKGLPRPVEQAHGSEIIAATARAVAPPVQPQTGKRSTEETPLDKFRTDALWAATECISAGRSIDPNLVATRAEMSRLYRHLVLGESDASVRLLSGWRRAAVGEALIEMVQKGGKLEVAWRKGTLAVETAAKSAEGKTG